MGLVNEVVPRSELDAAVERWVQQILACAPLSLRAIKQVVRLTATLSPAEAQGMRLPALVDGAAVRGCRTKACWPSSRNASPSGKAASGPTEVQPWPMSSPRPASTSRTAPASCAVPVDCIYEGERTLYIHPDECIDCGVCVSACPAQAIYEEFRLPPELRRYVAINREFFGTERQRPGLAGRRRRTAVARDHPRIIPGSAGVQPVRMMAALAREAAGRCTPSS